MKNRLRPKWGPLQRGFTKNSAPLNAAFILEEARREALDIGKLLTIILLDDYWSNSDTSVICNMQFGTFIFEYRR
jgi:hypothetical protein